MIAAAPVASNVYVASPIKPRQRSTRQQVDERREALITIVRAMQPMTVRQVFYQASVRGIVDKSEAGYAKVQTDLALLRRAGAMPYHWLADKIPAGSASPAPTAASQRRCATPPGSTGNPSGPARTATSRSGWRKTPSPASSTP